MSNKKIPQTPRRFKVELISQYILNPAKKLIFHFTTTEPNAYKRARDIYPGAKITSAKEK